MPLVFGCIVPHGNVIPGTPGAEKCATTTAAMQEIGRRMEAARPDVAVVVTPHGMRVDGAMTVSLSERAAGALDDPMVENGKLRLVAVDFAVDRDLARSLVEGATAAGVPVAAVHYGATSGPHDRYPLDWGAVVPLWFLGAHFTEQPQVVVMVPSRVLPLDVLARFGQVVAEAAMASANRVALIASADQAHAHRDDGPYGYDPAAAAFDEWMVEAIRAGDLERLLQADMELVRRACPDALWQTLVLAGALRHTPMRGELLSYERPTYFGMLAAAYTPS